MWFQYNLWFHYNDGIPGWRCYSRKTMAFHDDDVIPVSATTCVFTITTLKCTCLHRCWDEPSHPLRVHPSPVRVMAVTRQPCRASHWLPWATSQTLSWGESSHPWRTPRAASVWCVAHSVPRSWQVAQPGVISRRAMQCQFSRSLARTLSPLKGASQCRGCEGTDEATLPRLTRIAMTNDPPHTTSQTLPWGEPFHPRRTPRTASVWCMAHSVPSFMATCWTQRHFHDINAIPVSTLTVQFLFPQ